MLVKVVALDTGGMLVLSIWLVRCLCRSSLNNDVSCTCFRNILPTQFKSWGYYMTYATLTGLVPGSDNFPHGKVDDMHDSAVLLAERQGYQWCFVGIRMGPTFVLKTKKHWRYYLSFSFRRTWHVQSTATTRSILASATKRRTVMPAVPLVLWTRSLERVLVLETHADCVK